MDLTKQEFNSLPIGQKFIESCCSGTAFIKAVKVSQTEIERLIIDAYDFSAYVEKSKFNSEFDWLKPVEKFKNINEKTETFSQLKKLFGC